jgi:hypothetical protein
MVQFQLLAFSHLEALRIVSLKSFLGDEEELLAWGFNAKFEPFFANEFKPDQTLPMWEPTMKYGIQGGRCGGVNLNRTLAKGFQTRLRDGKIQRTIGVEAAAVHMSRLGLGITAREFTEKTEKLLTQGVQIIFIYKASDVCKMREAYGFKNSWIFSGVEPSANKKEIDAKKAIPYDMEKWNVFLKTNKSEWRIKTKLVEKALKRISQREVGIETE